jgi:uncharacterized protein (DUF885 family)
MTKPEAVDRSEHLSPIYALADRYVRDSCALDPIKATATGVFGYDDRLTDYSPEGVEARAELDQETAVALGSLERNDDRDDLAAAYLVDRLESALAFVDAEEHLRPIRNLGSPVQSIRQVFDLMPRATDVDWEIIARRMRAVPAALEGIRAALDVGIERDLTAARRQALEVAEQTFTWAGERGAPAFFEQLAASATGIAGVTSELLLELDEAALSASMAYAAMGTYLRDVYAPAATERDAVGADRYAFWARSFLGAEIDLEETYAWGWAELELIEARMAEIAEVLRPGAGIDATIHWLETESELVIEGEDNLRGWLQDLMDETIADMNGTHFDIPGPVQRVEAMIAPPGGAAAMYYSGPSEDFTRPGRTWYPTLGKTRFPLWGEKSIAYHEGVPGHHLQIGQVRYLKDTLSRVQRGSSIAGHAEGWALYAERLMLELGYLDEPAYELGMWRAQAMRAVRVIVDIGMHLELAIPTGQPFHPGEIWTPALGQEFVDARARFPKDFMASEIVRYLGLPGQAICYKVGERVWLEGRAAAQTRHADSFDLKKFHSYALDLGPLGLDRLHTELAKF